MGSGDRPRELGEFLRSLRRVDTAGWPEDVQQMFLAAHVVLHPGEDTVETASQDVGVANLRSPPARTHDGPQ